MTDSANIPESPPSTQKVVGRLFIVPLIIVIILIACAVVVVLSFGSIVSSRELPVDQLLAMLESEVGEKPAGVLLMPRDKELWQAAQELALRLREKDAEISPEELPEVQIRLTKILEKEVHQAEDLEPMGTKRLVFVMQAAALAEAVQALPILLDSLQHPNVQVRRAALNALALMDDVEAAKRAVPQIALSLRDPDDVVRMLCCVVLSRLADPDDTAAIQALSDAYLADESQEVRWNAALTLARLGSPKALPTVLDMLNREYWERQRVQYQPESGPAVDRPLTPNRVDEYLIAAIGAAAHLDDTRIWDAVSRLTDDSALSVANEARTAVENHQVPNTHDP